MSKTLAPNENEVQSRCAQYLEQAALVGREWFADDGSWKVSTRPLRARERLWLSFSYFETGQEEMGDFVVGTTDVSQKEYPVESTFNIFSTNIALVLLLRYRAQLSAPVASKLEAMVRDGFATWAGNRAPDYQFHGFNDNMPSKAAMGLILGGEMLGNPEAVEHGLWSLRQFAAQLTRRGINSEYNSPTYSPLSLHAMAEIAGHAQNGEARQLAVDIEARLWLDLAARFHKETGMLAGPYSRAYTVDLLGQVTLASSLLWFVLGDCSKMSPMRLFEPDEQMVLHNRGNQPFNIAQMCWLAAGEYHLSDATKRLFTEKTYPFDCVSTSEAGPIVSGGYPGCQNRLQTYQETDFSLGTSSVSFLNGVQPAAYFVTYRRNSDDNLDGLKDVGTVFSKMLLNDGTPGEFAPEDPEYTNGGEQDNLVSWANQYTLQSKSTAMLLSHPHYSLSGLDGQAPYGVRKLSELVCFSAKFGGADELYVGAESRDDWSGVVPRGQWIVCRRGRLLIGIRPLVYTRTMGEPTITLEQINGYEVIRSTFYDGEARTFSMQDCADVYGGFIAEHASVDDYASLEAFARELSRARIEDYFWTTRRVRYCRDVSDARPELEMETSWTPGSPEPRFAEINRMLVEWPAWEASAPGPDVSEIPLLGKPRDSVPHHFPWEHLRCVQAPWPWAIGDADIDLDK
ncbi:hypothetical protein [Cerasicoccus frondis]|uniref:hypothetical protein n=1 Tax=Cerasicoccus frondis TaxID=490090 RepID=UPI0028524AC8|nr:hypothetical protein [Cerasicoccus frondis]